MILMLDNYDSFTYNLVQYLCELGADLEVIRNDELEVDELLAMHPKAIVLSPGPGRPEKAGVMNELIEKADRNIPILGVCLGYQGMAQVYGAKITYAPTLMHGKTSDINHDNSTLYKNISSPFVATRYHSLIVDKKTLSDDFRITGWTNDGIIMSIEHKKFLLFGLQYHPESIMTPDGKTILKNFMELT